MRSVSRAVAGVITSTLVVLYGVPVWSTQSTVDGDNRHPNVGAIMVWRVNDAGEPVELRAFASGTLIRSRVMITAGHFTAPTKALGGLPPGIRMYASFSATDARDPSTWIPVSGQATHPSMPHCPPPPLCDPTDDILVAPLEPGIADVGLVFLERAPANIRPAALAGPGTLEKSERARTTIVGYGTTSPPDVTTPVGTWPWDGKRRIRDSAVRKVVDETWALWSIPSDVCFGDSGGGIFLNARLVANVSDGGRDCRRHNNHIRLDTRGIQNWIDGAIKEHETR